MSLNYFIKVNYGNVHIILLVCLFFVIDNIEGQTYLSTDVFISLNTKVSISNDLIISNKGNLINNGELTLISNVENNGNLSYSSMPNESMGIVRFIGEDQSFSGKGKTVFRDVSFDNDHLNLGSEIEINNDAYFNKGIINTRDFSGQIIFNDLSDYLNASTLSHVNGGVVYRGKEDFTFPIGTDNYYRPITLRKIDNPLDISIIYQLENSNNKYPHINKSSTIQIINDLEYWEVENNTSNDYVIVELKRNENTSSSEILEEDLSNIHIVQWDTNQNVWIDQGGIVNSADDSIKTISKVLGKGIFTLAICKTDNILPGGVSVYNALTPNGDGVNDILRIKEIENYPNNTVKIFNRWGELIWKRSGYNNVDIVFRGISNQTFSNRNTTILPSGTYFYSLEYNFEGKEYNKIDYLYLNNGE